MSSQARAFKKLLPVLQHLARFPGANARAICARHEFGLDVVDQFVREVFGGFASLDEETLAEAGSKFGVDVPAWKPAPLAGPKVNPSAPVVATLPRKLGRESAVLPLGRRLHEELPDQSEPARKGEESVASQKLSAAGETFPWVGKRRLLARVFEKYFPVLVALACSPDETAKVVCGRLNAPFQPFYQFKSDFFRGLEITPQNVEAFRRWAMNKLGTDFPAAWRSVDCSTARAQADNKKSVLPSEKSHALDAAKMAGMGAPGFPTSLPSLSAAALLSGNLLGVPAFRIEIDVRVVPLSR